MSTCALDLDSFHLRANTHHVAGHLWGARLRDAMLTSPTARTLTRVSPRLLYVASGYVAEMLFVDQSNSEDPPHDWPRECSDQLLTMEWEDSDHGESGSEPSAIQRWLELMRLAMIADWDHRPHR
jgi:hypothetical protein